MRDDVEIQVLLKFVKKLLPYSVGHQGRSHEAGCVEGKCRGDLQGEWAHAVAAQVGKFFEECLAAWPVQDVSRPNFGRPF